jgi:hypothetical protein
MRLPDRLAKFELARLDYLEIAKPQVIVYASRAPSWRYLDPDIPAFPEMPPRAPKDSA